MKNRYIGLLILIIILFLGFSVFSGIGTERIDIAGSTSVQPLAEQLAIEYTKDKPDLKINVQGGGSGMGIRSVSQEIADIGMSSKELNDEEKENVEVVEIGKEGIVIGVHNSNPIDDLSIEELKKIFSGEISNWKEVGGNDEEIHVVTREDGSGTRSAFESIVMDDSDIKNDAIVQSSTESVKQAVASDSAAIGYMSLAHMSDDVKSVKIEGVVPSEENIANGQYELQRPFLFIITKNHDETIDDFIKWVKSSEGRKIIQDEKIVPSN
ncbi:phosphate ABC transporter substrate-binding protein [Methanobrevibacter sp. OttesenSCG-928-K11]|nr:phosphate ABC transporter substrate-binding protein [Methanobrevibacter sp. OttesenSCG-928-K11]MDL2271345.1 phosphate ABC transporter substrate-binding protein [Methanobrevibacter sp. OttesenSCG-928-I08]